VKFHPSRPFFFVATKQHVRVYNLVKQQLSKKLIPNVKWISNIDIHPGGIKSFSFVVQVEKHIKKQRNNFQLFLFRGQCSCEQL
jgi:hypothetical protein